MDILKDDGMDTSRILIGDMDGELQDFWSEVGQMHDVFTTSQPQ
jgi:hypothetical protein